MNPSHHQVSIYPSETGAFHPPQIPCPSVRSHNVGESLVAVQDYPDVIRRRTPTTPAPHRPRKRDGRTRAVNLQSRDPNNCATAGGESMRATSSTPGGASRSATRFLPRAASNLFAWGGGCLMSFLTKLDEFARYVRTARPSITTATVAVTEKTARRALALKKADPLTYQGLQLKCIGSRRWRNEQTGIPCSN
jgi:hypothetical protein